LTQTLSASLEDLWQVGQENVKECNADFVQVGGTGSKASIMLRGVVNAATIMTWKAGFRIRRWSQLHPIPPQTMGVRHTGGVPFGELPLLELGAIVSDFALSRSRS
jgi:hypothetical protein